MAFAETPKEFVDHLQIFLKKRKKTFCGNSNTREETQVS
jgi:hypothetical protein